MEELLKQEYFHNSVQNYILALGFIVIGFLLIGLFKRILLKKIKKWTSNTQTGLDDYIISSIERFGIPALYLTVIYIGLRFLFLPVRFETILKIVITIAITFLLLRFLSSTILLLLQTYVRKQERGEEKIKQLGGLMIVVNIVIWAIGLLFLFDNMGYDVTTVIAGLGIGGIAVALAAQNILGDLFNYFVIFFDRPFETGDFIIIDDKMGVVDYIGIKSTRIKSLSGEQLVLSNSDLTSSRIHNYKRMERRRVLFRIGVTYQTSYEHIKMIPVLLKSIVEEQQSITFDRAHFASYGDSSLDFEVVYYVMQADYNKYMDIQQAINLRIFEEFSKSGVEFAYPTRTLFLMNSQTD